MVGLRIRVFWWRTMGLVSELDASGEDEGTGPMTIGRRTDGGMGGMEEDACGLGEVDVCVTVGAPVDWEDCAECSAGKLDIG